MVSDGAACASDGAAVVSDGAACDSDEAAVVALDEALCDSDEPAVVLDEASCDPGEVPSDVDGPGEGAAGAGCTNDPDGASSELLPSRSPPVFS